MPVFFYRRLITTDRKPSLLLRPPILNLEPRRLLRYTRMPLLRRTKRRIKCANCNRNPICIRAVGIRPKQRSPAVRTELPRDAGRRLKTLERLDATRNRNRRPRGAGISRKRGAVSLSALATMAMRNGFQRRRNLIFDCAAETASLMKFIHGHRLLDRSRGEARPAMLRRSRAQTNGRQHGARFLYSLTCARKRRPITSIKSQPSRNEMTSNLQKTHIGLHPVMAPKRGQTSALISTPLLTRASSIVENSSKSCADSGATYIKLPKWSA